MRNWKLVLRVTPEQRHYLAGLHRKGYTTNGYLRALIDKDRNEHGAETHNSTVLASLNDKVDALKAEARTLTKEVRR